MANAASLAAPTSVLRRLQSRCAMPTRSMQTSSSLPAFCASSKQPSNACSDAARLWACSRERYVPRCNRCNNTSNSALHQPLLKTLHRTQSLGSSSGDGDISGKEHQSPPPTSASLISVQVISASDQSAYLQPISCLIVGVGLDTLQPGFDALSADVGYLSECCGMRKILAVCMATFSPAHADVS